MKVGKREYTYVPVGLDMFQGSPYGPLPGDTVVKVQPFGCPKNGTMGHAYAAPVDNPDNYRLVLLGSLVRKAS